MKKQVWVSQTTDGKYGEGVASSSQNSVLVSYINKTQKQNRLKNTIKWTGFAYIIHS